MEYHSEPITRKLIRNYTAGQARRHGADREFLEDYETISGAEARKEDRERYFGLGVPTLSLFGMFRLPVFMLGFIGSLFMDISFWYIITIVLIPMMIFFALSFGFHQEQRRSLKDENYPASFSSSLMVFYSLGGVLIALILGYLLSMALS